MSQPISSYPITFPYGATTSPYSVASPHHGNDYPLNYEDVIVAGTKIGVSGETGKADGPHTHVQAGRDEWAQNFIQPLPYTDKPGTVVKTGNASQWGNYVCIKVNDVYVYYCHLSSISVKVGDIIEGEDMAVQDDISALYKSLDALNKKFDALVNGDGTNPSIFTVINNSNKRIDALESKASDVDLSDYTVQLVKK